MMTKLKTRDVLRAAAAALSLAALFGCGGGSSGPSPVPTPTPVPSATITAAGAGAIVLHPGLHPDLAWALEAPVRISETAGGTADWNWARIAFFKQGAEIERYELTADDIRAAGYSRIAARSNDVYTILFRFNSEDFEDIQLRLGFGDIKDGRVFEVQVEDTFTDVLLDVTPLSVPGRGTVRLGGR
jgi:hypothetical protein